MEENNYVVYKHTSPSGKVYIGITCQKPEKRWSSGYGYKRCTVFYNAIQKYGWDNFKHEILYSGLNEISAKMIEEDLIYYYKSLNISYNITDGGDGQKGRIPSKETRKKMSDAKKGNIPWNKGKHHSIETIQKISISHKEKHLSEEHKRKISESLKGKVVKSVSQYSKDGRFINTYNSITEAENETKINHSDISECCNKVRNRKTAGGFIWKFNQ